MEKVKVSLVIQNHLSDALVEIRSNPILTQKRLRFVKYLIHFYPDITQGILVDFVYEQFKKSMTY